MISKAITEPIQWWAKHPWMAFWGITLLGSISLMAVNSAIIIPLSNDVLDFAHSICFPVLVIAWNLSFFRGMFLTWQRSKVRAVLAVAAFAITIILLTITAQEAYFVDNDTFTPNIDSLKSEGQGQGSSLRFSIDLLFQ